MNCNHCQLRNIMDGVNFVIIVRILCAAIMADIAFIVNIMNIMNKVIIVGVQAESIARGRVNNLQYQNTLVLSFQLELFPSSPCTHA